MTPHFGADPLPSPPEAAARPKGLLVALNGAALPPLLASFDSRFSQQLAIFGRFPGKRLLPMRQEGLHPLS